MKALIVHDSVYGNTERLARTMADAIDGESKVLHVNEVNLSDLESIDLLIVGSPTRGGGPTPSVKDFLNRFTEHDIKGINVAAFDTRVSWRWVRIFGYAAEKIASALKEKGGTLMAPPVGFFVKGNKDSIIDGELERAASWAREITGGSLHDTQKRNGTNN